MASPTIDRFAAATTAFGQTLEALELGDEDLNQEAQQALGRRAALLGAAEIAWRDHLGPLLHWQQVAEILQSVTTRQGVNDRGRRGRLLAVETKAGQVLYPAFQFRGGRALPSLPELLAAFKDTDTSPWTVASWFVTPQDELEGQTPALWLSAGRPTEPVKLAARRTAAGRAH